MKAAPERVELLGLPLDLVTLEGAVAVVRGWLESGETRTVVTLNPEIVVQAETDPALRGAIRAADLVTADGVGIVWAARRLLGRSVPGRATGVDLAARLMELEGPRLRVYFLGSRPGVAERAAERCRERYGVAVVGARHGYFLLDEADAVAAAVGAARPHLLLTGLGARRQEVFNEAHRAALGAVAMGVGGTIDVLAGEVERAPAWTTRLGVEWVYRVVTMRRWGRARRLAEFTAKVLAASGRR